MNTTSTPEPKPPAAPVVRESDGRHQLVGYLGWKAIRSTPKPKPPAAPVVRESDGRHQLVGYLGWKAILERLARRRP